ncbi:retrotransposon protein, putative, unclassified [Tanacetum coccineum]
MECGFLSQKGSECGRGVKEKNKNIGLRSYPPLPTHGSTLSGNTPGMSSYANVTGVPSGKALNFRTLFTPGGNRVDVVVLVQSFRAISDRFTNTAYGFFLGKRVAYPVVAKYVRNTWGKYGLVKSMFSSSTGLFSFQFSFMDGLNIMLENGPWFIRNNPLILKKWEPDVNLMKEDVESVLVWVKLHGVPVTVSSYARAMIKLRADVELKDTIVVAMLKLTGKGFYTSTECPKNPGLGVAKNLKKPIQAPRGVPVGPKVGFKLTKKFRPASKKPTANTSGTKKKGVEPTKEVSNSNPFYVLNSVENDRELGTNGGTSNLASNGANSSGSSFWNVETSSTSTTPIIDKIRKLEKLIIGGRATLMDDAGKPLKKVEYSDDHDSKNEVESVDNDMARSMASESVGFYCAETQTIGLIPIR